MSGTQAARVLFLACLLSTATSIVPLVDKHFSYPDGMPVKADPDNGPRGTQVGYNQCGPNTAGQSSLCQTSFLNSVDDFCLWAPINPNSIVGVVEGEMVAWCTKPGRGTRVIPAGAITGVQFTKTPDYVQVVGFIDQSMINLASDDSGGEMDPHGADLRGNPLGGLMYSNAFTSNKNLFEQVIEWHNFMGSNMFCLKACDPAGANAANFCQHIYDRIGCQYNAPSNAKPGTFESCRGDDQDFPGVYTDSQGKVQTYTQPPESEGAITSIPYTPRVPNSSDCVQFQSAELFAGSVSTGSGGPPPTGGVTVSQAFPTGSGSQTSSVIASAASDSSSRGTPFSTALASPASTQSTSTITAPPTVTSGQPSLSPSSSLQSTSASGALKEGNTVFQVIFVMGLGFWAMAAI